MNTAYHIISTTDGNNTGFFFGGTKAPESGPTMGGGAGFSAPSDSTGSAGALATQAGSEMKTHSEENTKPKSALIEALLVLKSLSLPIWIRIRWKKRR